MKHLLFTCFWGLLCLCAHAQHACDSLIFQVKTPSGTTTYPYGECGFTVPWWSNGPITAPTCLPLAWAYDITPDSLCCDSIPNNLTGTAALIRRGGCESSTKALRAEGAGAAAIVIINHYNSPDDTNCSPLLPGTEDLTPLDQAPVFLLCRKAGEQITAALKAGLPVEICFARASLRCPTAEYSYATPVSQAGPMDLFSVLYRNRTASPQADVVCKADIVAPDGKLTTLTAALGAVAAGEERLVRFPTYDAPKLEGKFRVTYSNDQFTERYDTVRREFVQTKYTYATDNLQPNGSIGPSQQQFADAGYKCQSGGMVFTGPKGLIVLYASFGLGNASEIAVGDPAADVINVLLYDNDANDDGKADFDTAFTDLFPVAFADYFFKSTQAPNALIYTELESLNGIPKVELKPNHLYMISILYDGNIANTGNPPTFTCSKPVYYPQFPDVGLHTPLLLDELYGGWPNATLVTRLYEEGFLPTISTNQPSRLSEARYAVTPNPANDVVRLNLELEGVNKSVAATLIDFQGRAVSTQVARDIQNDQITFDATKLPSGAYSLWIRTSNEGSTMAKLMICH